MPKRKRNKEEKIQKLERKLEKYKKLKQMEEDVEVGDNESVLDPEDPFVMEEAQPPECPEEIEEDLIAEALGEPCNEEGYGAEIHPHLASLMVNILEKGLSKGEKEVLKTIKIPENCKLLDAPKLNKELTSVLTPMAKTRDKLMQERQQELGQSAATIAQAIHILSRKDFSKVEVMKKLGEASRIICNLHFQYTEVRRKLVSPFLDKNLSENLKENKRGELLYSNLDDSVKSFAAIKRASDVIKPKISGSKTGNGNNSFTNQTRHTKNSQLPRRQYQSNIKRGAYHQHTQQRQGLKSSNSRYQAGQSHRGRAKYP